jgi:hypothetical protein
MRGAPEQSIVNPRAHRPSFVGSVVIALVAAVTCTFAAPPASVPPVINFATSPMDYPLALHTRWTYHLRRELAPGAHFEGEDAALAKGNVLEDSVVSEIAGEDRVGALSFARVENRRPRGLWLTEWYRATADGLFFEKTLNSEQGSENVVSPPQKVLAGTLRPGDSWEWQADDASSRIRANVIGASAVTVPAGTYSATEIGYLTTSPTPYGTARVEQTCWFVPGVGWVKQETRALIETHLLIHVTLTLEKFEPAATR